MCFTSKKIYPSKAVAENALVNCLRTAEKEFRVYKTLKKEKSSGKLTYLSPIYHFKYKKGYRYDETLQLFVGKGYTNDEYLIRGTVGLHSHKWCRNTYRSFPSMYEVVEMYIPEGATYMVGLDNDIISSALIWY